MSETVSPAASLTDPAVTARLVVKVGSALLVGSDGKPRGAWLSALVAELAAARARGQQIIVVSSGAIALGARKLGLPKGGNANLADAQAAASVGQIALAGLWADLLAGHDLTAAQMLLTLEDLEDRRRYLNASATLERLLSAGAVPVINENDSVATQEIRFGDNDRLAARVAQAANAGGVLLLSDIDGLYDRNPRDPAAVRIPQVRGVTPEIMAMADSGSGSGMGRGGMVSKLQAAQIANLAGIPLAIIDGREESPISHALMRGTGTLFVPGGKARARKAWLGGRLRVRGTVTVDEGAMRALDDGKSLLAAGIVAVEGSFVRGDVVAVSTAQGRTIAHGLVEYGADEVALILGRQTAEQADLLGYAPRSAVIHRDQLVPLP